MMDKIIDKIEIYHLLNYLIPGIVFYYFYINIGFADFLVNNNSIFSSCFFYFLGLFLSRIGSLFIEPILIKLKVIKYKDYKYYLCAERKDIKIKLLQREANQYRTYISMFLILCLMSIYRCFVDICYIKYILLIFAFFIVFVFSYIKQINYIIE